MKPLVTVCLAFTALAGVAATAQAQYAPPSTYDDAYGVAQDPGPAPTYNPNVQSYRDYQRALSAYDEARDTSARERDAYDRRSADYRANRAAYRHQLRAYERARADYDERYGPGAYEQRYAPPPAPPD